ncbi:hypothetical protein ES705_43953 [subsurface metagenome]
MLPSNTRLKRFDTLFPRFRDAFRPSGIITLPIIHFQALYKAGNRLGVVLITHTHLLETWKRIREREKGLGNPSPNASGASPSPICGKRIRSSTRPCSPPEVSVFPIWALLMSLLGKSVEAHPAELVFGYTRLAEAQFRAHRKRVEEFHQPVRLPRLAYQKNI